MFNLHDKIKAGPEFYRQLRCGDALVTLFHCLLENRYEDTWSQHNYIVYVVEGRKIWHTPNGSYDLNKGDCVFVRKGAAIVEQFFETTSCFILFFIPDEFIRETLRDKPLPGDGLATAPVIALHKDSITESFFQSMTTYFERVAAPDPDLLELKFRELVLTLADNTANTDLRAYFSSLQRQPRSMSLQQVMEQNFCFNLKLEEFAQLSARSLSAFKRDFESLYGTTPGKWLLEKRLQYAAHLLGHKGRTVAEAAFESGFENVSHFSRVFKQRFGTPPISLRAVNL